MAKEKFIIVENEKEHMAGRVWKALGKNNMWRRINAFIVLCVLLGAVILGLFIAGKYGMIYFSLKK
jgi:fatty-acid desaturase